MTWLSAIRKASIRMVDDARFDSAVDSLKNAKSGVASIDDVLKRLPYTRRADEVHVNGVRWRDKVTDLRVGNVRQTLHDMQVHANVSPADESAFKSVLRSQDLPDFVVSDLETDTRYAKRVHVDLDVTLHTGAELENALSPASKAKVDTIMDKVKKAVGTAAVATGLFAAIAIGGDLYENLARATKERDGCYIVETVNGVTSACKIVNRSCSDAVGPTPCLVDKIKAYIRPNLYMTLRHLIETNDTQTLNDIRDKCGGIVLTDVTLDEVLSRDADVSKLLKYVDEHDKLAAAAIDPCKFATTDVCAACDPSADVTSARYLDDSRFPDNWTVKCVTGSTILDTLVDVTSALGVDVFAKASESAGSVFGNLYVRLVLAAFVALVLASLYARFFRHDGGYTRQHAN